MKSSSSLLKTLAKYVIGIALIMFLYYFFHSEKQKLQDEIISKEEAVAAVKNDLLEHPEFILKVAKKLKEKEDKTQKTQKIQLSKTDIEKLINNPKDPALGSSDPNIIVVEFFDYQCPFCQRFAPSIESVLKSNGDVKVVYKEAAIFANRFEASGFAADAAISIYHQFGAKAFQDFHDGLFGMHIPEGKLTVSTVHKLIMDIGIDDVKVKTGVHKSNTQLFSDLGLGGTPATFVINAKTMKYKFINGARSQELYKAIHSVRQE